MALQSERESLRAMGDKTRAVYRYIVRYMAAHDGLAPSQHEIASGVGIAEGGHVQWHLKRLKVAGLIVLPPGVRRGIRRAHSESGESSAPPVAPPGAKNPDPSEWEWFIRQQEGAWA